MTEEPTNVCVVPRAQWLAWEESGSEAVGARGIHSALQRPHALPGHTSRNAKAYHLQEEMVHLLLRTVGVALLEEEKKPSTHKPIALMSQPESKRALNIGWMEGGWLHIVPLGGPQSPAIASHRGEPMCAGMQTCSTPRQGLAACTSRRPMLADVEAQDWVVVSRFSLCARKEHNYQHMELCKPSWDMVVEQMIVKPMLIVEAGFIR